jgi:hypothetical protein
MRSGEDGGRRTDVGRLVEEITAGASGDDAQLRAFLGALGRECRLPCDGFVIGEPVSAQPDRQPGCPRPRGRGACGLAMGRLPGRGMTRFSATSLDAGPSVLTIGHGNHEGGELIDLLRRHRVEALVDVKKNAQPVRFSR